jgi:hypothetical protein
MNFWKKWQNDTHETCMNGVAKPKGYTPNVAKMYEFPMKFS